MCELYKGVFAVGEDEEAPSAQPDPQVLSFISLPEFKKGLQRVNEMMNQFENRSQPLWINVLNLGTFALMMWTILASSINNFAGVSDYPSWAVALGWVAVIGSFIVAVKNTQQQEADFRESVENELRELWRNAVARGVTVAFKNVSSGENVTYPASVTITLPYHA